MMVTRRSKQKELLDLGSAYYTEEEYSHCQKMLFYVNKMFGFLKSTEKKLQLFPSVSSVLDVGCGAGLFILHLSQLFPSIHFHGIDISKEAIQLANKELSLWQATRNTKHVSFGLSHHQHFDFSMHAADIILSTLMCHHLSDEELIEFLVNAFKAAGTAVILNDLHRHFLALGFYRLLSPVLFQSRLISHDGYISIKRGFLYTEWEHLLMKAGIKHYAINWCFPFRWQIILWKK